MTAVVLRADLTEQHDRPRRARGARRAPRPQARWSGFAGVVRDHDGGRTVTRLEYSAHPSAQQTLADVAAEIAADCRRCAGDRRQPPHRRAGDRRRRVGGRRRRRPSAGGIRDVRPVGGQRQGPATGVEAPVLRRRLRRVGRTPPKSGQAGGRQPGPERRGAGGAAAGSTGATAGSTRRGSAGSSGAGPPRASGVVSGRWVSASSASLPVMSCVWIACQISFRYDDVRAVGRRAEQRSIVGARRQVLRARRGAGHRCTACDRIGGDRCGRGRRRRAARVAMRRVDGQRASSGCSPGTGTSDATLPTRRRVAHATGGASSSRGGHRIEGCRSAGGASGSGAASASTWVGGRRRRRVRHLVPAQAARLRVAVRGAGGAGAGSGAASVIDLGRRRAAAEPADRRGRRRRRQPGRPSVGRSAGGGGGANGSMGAGGGGSTLLSASTSLVDDVARRRTGQALTARRPRALALAGEHALGDGDLLFLGGQVRGGRVLAAAVTTPGAGRELQSALIAVSGVDGPVAAGFAAGDAIPFAIGRGAGMPGEGEASAADALRR